MGADYENSNLGIRALTTGALIAIDARYPNASVKILDYGADPREFVFDLPCKTVCVQMLNIRFSKKVWVKNHIACLIVTALLAALVPSRALRRRLLIGNPWLQALVQMDCVFSLNYGDSFSDIYGIQRFVYVTLPQLLAFLLKKPVVQLPQTIGPFKSPICRAVARWVLSRSDAVYTRDEQAVATVRALVPEHRSGRVRFCHDLGFVVPPTVFSPSEQSLDEVFSRRPVVGFNVSGLLWMGGYTRNNMFGLATDYRSLVRKAVSHFIEVKGSTVLLVPHVISPEGEGDPLACEALLGELQHVYAARIFTLRPPFNEREVKHVISRCDFFVGARMHACIAALSQCVPAAAMAYSDKFTGVLRSVGVQSTVSDLRSLSETDVLAALSSNFDSREMLKLALHERIPEVQRNVAALLDERNFDTQAFYTDANPNGEGH
jgi:polysaccharide pyruvyl transferase WcaK-like protein